MKDVKEAYRKIGDPDDRFDIDYWQDQGVKAIFEAARQMVLDAERLKGRDVNQLRMDRTAESLQKL